MNNMREWLNVFSEKTPVAKKHRKVKESKTCDCRLYTCGTCFPDNYNTLPETIHVSDIVAVGDAVKIAESAGGGSGTVDEIKGEYIQVIRDYDKIRLLVHEDDLSPIISKRKSKKINESMELRCPNCGEHLGKAQEYPRGEVHCGNCSEDFYNRFGYDPLEDEPEYWQYESEGQHEELEPITDALNLEEIVADDNQAFDLYCDLSQKLNGRVKGRSKFLAMPEDERLQVLNDMQSQL